VNKLREKLHATPAISSALDDFENATTRLVSKPDRARHCACYGLIAQISGPPVRRAAGLCGGCATVAATMAVAELLRLLHGGPVHELIDLDLKFPCASTSCAAPADFSLALMPR
jgi:hypothetical protein